MAGVESGEADGDKPGSARSDPLDLDVFISNDRMAIRFLVIAFLFALASGVGLMVASQQTILPLDPGLGRAAATLSGACLTGLGGFPLMQILTRMETLRVLERIREARATVGDADLEARRRLEGLILKLYEKRVIG